MAKRKGSSGSGEAQYSITQHNLDRKGKTNKKLKNNSMASKYLTPTGKELKEKAEAYAKEHFKKGRRTELKKKKAEEAKAKEEQLRKEQDAKREYKNPDKKPKKRI